MKLLVGEGTEVWLTQKLLFSCPTLHHPTWQPLPLRVRVFSLTWEPQGLPGSQSFQKALDSSGMWSAFFERHPGSSRGLGSPSSLSSKLTTLGPWKTIQGLVGGPRV